MQLAANHKVPFNRWHQPTSMSAACWQNASLMTGITDVAPLMSLHFYCSSDGGLRDCYMPQFIASRSMQPVGLKPALHHSEWSLTQHLASTRPGVALFDVCKCWLPPCARVKSSAKHSDDGSRRILAREQLRCMEWMPSWKRSVVSGAASAASSAASTFSVFIASSLCAAIQHRQTNTSILPPSSVHCAIKLF